MARNAVTLTFLGDSKNLEKTVDGVDSKLARLSVSIKDIGRNTVKGGLLAGIGSGALAAVGPLGAASAALAAFGAVAAPELKKGSKGAKELGDSFHGLQKSMKPFVDTVIALGAKTLKDALPALKVLATAGGHVVEAFLKPLDSLVQSGTFGKLITSMGKFAVIAGNLLGPQLIKLIGVFLQLFVQLMPAGIQILNVLLPLIVTLVTNLAPAIVVMATVTAWVLNWLKATHLLIPAIALLGLTILVAGGPVWAIVAAIAALIAIGVMLFKNWHTIWGGIKSIVADVWNWIKGHWPLLLDILAGPIGVAAGFIIHHWAQIKNAGIDVFNWIRALPARIGSVFANVGRAISSPFVYAFNLIRSAWNNTVGGKGFSIPSWVPVIGGDSFHIPYFHTGGIVGGSGDQLAMVKGGEGVFTRQQMAAMGNGSNRVVIEWAGGQADGEFMTWLKRNVRINGGDPAVMGR